jgi:hypothetical protein
MAVKNALNWREKDGEIVHQPEIFIAEHCYNTRRHLSRYSFNDIETPLGDSKDAVKPKEKYKDFADCSRYFCLSNPVYIEPAITKPPKAEKVY